MRILIAEDDQVLADGLLRSLRAAGAAVDHVASGTEADAALMTNNEFDLLILDLGLPKMHGLEVLRKLRAPRLADAGADPHRRRRDRGARQGPGPRRRRLHGQALRAAGTGSAGARAHPPRHGRHQQHHQARPAGVRPGRPRGHHRRQDGRAVGARAGPAGGAAAARRPAGQQGPAGRAPVRMGRGGEQQRHRGLHPPPAQEDREGPDPHRHRARPGLLPREDPGT